MGSITSAFQQKKNKNTVDSTNSPFFKNTGYSSVTGDTLHLDPSIRGIQDTALQQYAGQYGDIGEATNKYITGLRGIRSSYLGNEGALMKARLRPVQEQNAAMLGQTQRNVGLRGLSGSSFGEQAMTNASTTAGRNEADARALATVDMANFEKGLTDSEYNAYMAKAQQLASITGMSLEVAKARTAQELSILGIGSQTQDTAYGKSQDFGIVGTGKVGSPTP